MSLSIFTAHPALTLLWAATLIAWMEICRRTSRIIISDRAVDHLGEWPSVIAVVPARNGRLMKRQGAIRLSLTRASRSLRVYDWRDLFAMIARSAFSRLNYSAVALTGAVIGVIWLFWMPWFLAGSLRLIGNVPLVLSLLTFGQTNDFYRRSILWALALPLIAAFYLAATIASALQHRRSQGGMWKGRAQAPLTSPAAA